MQSPPGILGGAAPSLDPRTGAHHLLIPRPVDHLQGVVSAMLHVLRARWTVCKGASIPHDAIGSRAVGSRIEKRSKLPGTGGARVDAFVETRVGDGATVARVSKCTWGVWGAGERCNLCMSLHESLRAKACRKRAAADCGHDAGPSDDMGPDTEAAAPATSGSHEQRADGSRKRLKPSEDEDGADEASGPGTQGQDDFAYLEQRHAKSLLKLEALKVGEHAAFPQVGSRCCSHFLGYFSHTV